MKKFNPFRPTRQKTDVLLCRFLESLVMPRSASNFRRLSCTLLKKIANFSKLFSYSCFDILQLFSCEKIFFKLILWYVMKIFHLFQYCNFITYCYIRTSEEKKFFFKTLNFFSNSAFLLFFRIFYTYDVISQ